MYLFERYPTGLTPEQRAITHAGITTMGAAFHHRSVSPADLALLAAETDAVPVGSVPFVRAWAAQQGLETRLARQWPGCYPPALYKHLRRSVWSASLDEARALLCDRPLFVKPALFSDIKAFTGQIVSGTEPAEIMCQPSDMRVWCATPATWVAEFRVYVTHDQIVGCARYDDGEADVASPDLVTVRNMIADFPGGPAGYGLDVGVTPDGETTLIEVNDGWALGFYAGCDHDAYRTLLDARWAEVRDGSLRLESYLANGPLPRPTPNTGVAKAGERIVTNPASVRVHKPAVNRQSPHADGKVH